ncbi:DUF1472 domain-containing protein, partial [Salmonella enterica subsp. enterica serovar Java]|nr:DUF1472 domain-containing protein [Salmonella enterica subsp. enterica serovar Java]
SNSRQPCASGCGFPCALASLQARQRWRHGTARCRRTCDYGGFGNVCCCTCCIRWNLAQIQLWKHRWPLV